MPRLGQNETTTSDKVAIGLSVFAVLASAAAVIIRYRNSKQQGDGTDGTVQGLGRAGAPKSKLIERKKAGGMTLSVFTDSSMPIAMRVGLMQDLVQESVQHQEIHELGAAIIGNGKRKVKVGKYNFDVAGANCHAGDPSCKADAIGRWVASNVRYTGDVAPVKMGRGGDVEGIDMFQAARRTIEIGGGDCDDQSIVNGALLESVGIPAIHRVTAPRPNGDWAHVYAAGAVGNGQLAVLDTTLPGYRTGKEAPHGRKADFPSYRK